MVRSERRLSLCSALLVPELSNLTLLRRTRRDTAFRIRGVTVKDAASQYIARGWSVTTLKPKDKKCIDDDWLTKVYTPDDFRDTHNIGIKSINGLVDIDCDCTEAVFMAEAFLPKTKAIYGRASRPRSHWIFICAEIKDPAAIADLVEKKVRTDNGGKGFHSVNIVEIRVNHQSMAPPSIHPEGEVVIWYCDGEAMKVDRLVLLRAVQLLATGVMIARYYNPPGARHDWGVALAGFLKRLGVTQHEAERLLEHAAKWAQDDKVKDRFDAVRTTYTVSEDTPTTGGKRLTELMANGEQFVASLHKIWGAESSGVSKTKLEELNKKHAVLFLQGGSLTIMTEEVEDGKRQIRYSSRADFSLLYPQPVQVGVTAAGKPIVKNLGEAWVTNPKRRFYKGIELAPNGKPNEGYYNLWQGFSVEPKQGDWSLYRKHIDLLSEGSEEWANYIIAWMAETVQHPERPIGIALAFKGGQGVGKSTFAKWFGALFGAHFLHLDSEHRLLGQFNAHLHNTIVVLADEAVWAGGKQGLGALKRMVTEDTLAIERKGVDVINAKNMLHMIVASNEDWFVPTGFDNRRFAIFKVSDARQNQYKFFAAVADQLFHQGGLAALLYDLLEFKPDINLRAIPQTSELLEQKKHSMNPRMAWWYEQLHSGAPWQGSELLPSEGDGIERYMVDPELLYSAYITSMKMGENRVNPGFMGAVGRFMKTVLPTPFPDGVQHDGKRFWILPGLDVSREFFDKVMKARSEWPKDAKADLVDVPF